MVIISYYQVEWVELLIEIANYKLVSEIEIAIVQTEQPIKTEIQFEDGAIKHSILFKLAPRVGNWKQVMKFLWYIMKT